MAQAYFFLARAASQKATSANSMGRDASARKMSIKSPMPSNIIA